MNRCRDITEINDQINQNELLNLQVCVYALLGYSLDFRSLSFKLVYKAKNKTKNKKKKKKENEKETNKGKLATVRKFKS